MNKFSEMWDTKVRPAAQKVIKNATTDKVATEYYVTQMIWAVEHDLADGALGLKSLDSLGQIKGVFSRTNPTYVKNVHPNTPVDELERMYSLSDLIGELMKIA
jgi:hypothetical protein